MARTERTRWWSTRHSRRSTGSEAGRVAAYATAVAEVSAASQTPHVDRKRCLLHPVSMTLPPLSSPPRTSVAVKPGAREARSDKAVMPNVSTVTGAARGYGERCSGVRALRRIEDVRSDARRRRRGRVAPRGTPRDPSHEWTRRIPAIDAHHPCNEDMRGYVDGRAEIVRAPVRARAAAPCSSATSRSTAAWYGSALDKASAPMRTILVIGDAIGRSEVLAGVEAAGCSVSVAPTPDDAKRLVADRLPAAIFVGASRGADPYAMVRWLRGQGRLSFVPLFFCPSAGDGNQSGQAIVEGADDVLTVTTTAVGDIARQVVARVVRAQALADLAMLDPLTQLHNRRFMSDRFPAEIARAQRTGVTLSLALLDLDEFKTINDTFGHFAGDQALVAFAEALRAGLRSYDIICRFGGDEPQNRCFLGCDASGARTVLAQPSGTAVKVGTLAHPRRSHSAPGSHNSRRRARRGPTFSGSLTVRSSLPRKAGAI